MEAKATQRRDGWIRAATMWIGMMTLCQGSAAGADALAVPPYIPIERQYLDLPKGMQPVYPTFVSDGRDILFQNVADHASWLIRSDGSDLHCITCGFPDSPGKGLLAYAFPDDKRLLLTQGVAMPVDSGPDADGWVLECAPSLRDCASHRYLSIDMSADRGAFPLLQRRTWHLAPDGVHVGWMDVRSDGTVMVVARLERRSDKYVAADPRAVNPIGPTSSDDHNADRWEHLSQLYELKSFTPDGKGILAVGLPHNNIDVLRIDLSTGHVTRLTAHPDWDEDSSLSPDQSLFVVNSWRGRHRTDAIAWIPEIRGFLGLMFGAAIAPYYVSTWTGFQCDLSPWLLPAPGDDGGRLMGQPLDVYGGDLTAADHLEGPQNWSPDSTMLLLQERTRTHDVVSPNRIAIAKLVRAPTKPVTHVYSRIGHWAPPARAYRGPHAQERTVVVRGNAGGQAAITYKGALGAGASTSVTFDHFTDDGSTYVTGTMSGASEKEGDGEKREWILRADISVTGRHTGTFSMDLTVDNAAKPLPTMAGPIKAIYDGTIAPPLPPLAPCYDTQPKASPLRLDLTRTAAGVQATVSADISRDVRPVMNASVTFGATSVHTDARGQAMLRVGHYERPEVTATAGDTFLSVRATVPE